MENLESQFRIQNPEFWIQNPGFWILDPDSRIRITEARRPRPRPCPRPRFASLIPSSHYSSSWKTPKWKLKELMFSSLPLRASVEAGGSFEYSASSSSSSAYSPPPSSSSSSLSSSIIFQKLEGMKRMRRRRISGGGSWVFNPSSRPHRSTKRKGAENEFSIFQFFSFVNVPLGKNKASDKEHWFSFGN